MIYDPNDIRSATFAIAREEVRDGGRELVALCGEAFNGFDPAYLLDRLPHLTDPMLLTARDVPGLAAFKLGYRRGAATLYSWLGAVLPYARRRGLALALMREQHRLAREAGYRWVETRTRASNGPMLIVNLRSGFVVTGFEMDAGGHAVVSQRLDLTAPADVP